jgi:hypothetical protein
MFIPLGELPAHSETIDVEDGCLASCYDWYGNARPIFVKDRVFALLGYEIAEAKLTNSMLQEVARVDFSAHTPRRQHAFNTSN